MKLTIDLVSGLLGQKARSHQTSLSKSLAVRLEAAPLKNPLSQAKEKL